MGDHMAADISWSARSLIAATGLAVCLMMTAFGATASVKKAEAARIAEQQIADEATLIAEFADYLSAETANTRAGFDAPSMKPAKSVAALAVDDASIAHFVDFDFSKLDASAVDAADRTCLAQAIYYEARSESRIGQVAVADVVLNRVASKYYPNSICGVVFQGSERRTGCQFSFTCDGSMNARLNKRKWQESEQMAGAILAGMHLPVSRNATHYHAYYVSPPWAETLTPTAVIGAHKFYRFPSKSVTQAAPAAM